MVNHCKSKKCLSGKTAIITGSNTGIGYETALDFAQRGCRVILACRSQERANEAREKIVKATENENVVVKLLDLSSLAAVRKFAQDINETEPRLDLLINNAGASYLPNTITPDGMQLEMQTNYFSPFLLTHLLLDLLKKSAPSRIVNVSALAGAFYDVDLDKIDDFPGNIKLYCNTKLCQILFTQELAKRLEGTGVTTYSLHPGIIKTELLRNSGSFTERTMNFIWRPFSQSLNDGAQTTIYCALEDGIEELNGAHFDDCKPVKTYRYARDEEKAKKLWKISEQKVGLAVD